MLDNMTSVRRSICVLVQGAMQSLGTQLAKRTNNTYSGSAPNTALVDMQTDDPRPGRFRPVICASAWATCLASLALIPLAAVSADPAARVTVKSEGWELVGDLQIPKTSGRVPGVLLLNKAAGDRHVYKTLAGHLADRGIASLRLDLRGHGESTNLGRFVPDQATDEDRETMIWGAEADVVAAHRFLKSHPRIDARRIGVVGGSYSGEEMAEAGRLVGYAQAYVALSPGSFSEASIAAMDPSGIPWLFLVSRHERHLTEIAAAVQSRTKDVEIVYIPGEQHATLILEFRPDVAERIAVWLASKLSPERRNEE